MSAMVIVITFAFTDLLATSRARLLLPLLRPAVCWAAAVMAAHDLALAEVMCCLMAALYNAACPARVPAAARPSCVQMPGLPTRLAPRHQDLHHGHHACSLLSCLVTHLNTGAVLH